MATITNRPYKLLFSEKDKTLIETFDRCCKRFNIPNVLDDYMNHRLPASIPNMCLDTMGFSRYSLDHNENDIGFYEYGEQIAKGKGFGGFFVRDLIIRTAGFSLITKNLTYVMANFIKKYTKKSNPVVLEIGCGTGCLSKGLLDRGIDMIPTDSSDWFGTTFSYNNLWIPRNEIQEIEMSEAVKKYAASVDMVICSWPTSGSSIADVPKLIYENNPSCKLLYCGEWYDGCTANDKFFDVIKECDGFNYGIESHHRMHQTWDWIHDYWHLLEYDPASESVEGQSTNDFNDDLHNKLDNIAKEINGVKNSIVNITNDIIIDVCKIKQTIAQDE